MSGVVLKKGIGQPWASESVTRFINSLGYKEITLKSDTEPTIFAFRHRVAENCKAEVTFEDAVKGDKPSNGLVGNAVMLLRGVIRTIKCHVESCTPAELREDSPILPLLVEHAGGVLSRCLVGCRSKDCMARSQHKSLCHSGEGVGETNIIRTVEQNEPRHKFGVRNNSAECFVGTAEGV